MTDSQNDHMDQYINRFCADTLTSISFHEKSRFSVDNFQKPFANVTEVQIIGVNLEKKLPHFIDWFPNVRYSKWTA